MGAVGTWQCHREDPGQYISDWLDFTLKAEAEQDNRSDPALKRLKAMKQSRTVQLLGSQIF
ncbi:MAG: hypothetical protein HC771_13165 [Synechococcales cyanobacterium CRU_2_2]|nr:hypothetical protein [Synechococcales cyanobacterium CRU_2_2]